ncbi:MAG: SdiA-regulated domain-containing protein [Planctomycetota bacterium]|nr:SdiA-regulated domain-containing protein [Planctomycetota bacterium]
MFAIGSLVGLLSTGLPAQQPFPGVLPGMEIGATPLPGSFEPSGAIWHPLLQRLFLVSDSGLVASMQPDGSGLQLTVLPGDLEAVTYVDYADGRLYIGRENPDAILEYDLATESVLRTFDLTAFMTGPANQGLEALTFVPMAGHAEGGEFWAGLQDTGEIFRFELPLQSSATSSVVNFLGTFRSGPALEDISGMHYDRANATLYSIHDRFDVLRAGPGLGAPLDGEWTLPGNAQEGFAMDGCGQLFLAEDVGPEVWVYQSFPTSFPSTWSNYGVGHPGTLGVPSLTLSADPVIGTTPIVEIGNSLGASMLATVVMGLAQTALPTGWGGTLLVDNFLLTETFVADSTGTDMPLALPDDPGLCGLPLNIQVAEFDPGASLGISFSRGLALVVGR